MSEKLPKPKIDIPTKGQRDDFRAHCGQITMAELQQLHNSSASIGHDIEATIAAEVYVQRKKNDVIKW